jgi:hypothetical protein
MGRNPKSRFRITFLGGGLFSGAAVTNFCDKRVSTVLSSFREVEELGIGVSSEAEDFISSSDWDDGGRVELVIDGCAPGTSVLDMIGAVRKTKVEAL